MKNQVIGLVVVALMFCGVTSVNATIITTSAGIENLEWLEFSFTNALSRDEVEAHYLTTAAYDGYRYATRLETELLLDSYYTVGTGDLHNDGVDNGYNLETYNATDSFLADFGEIISDTSTGFGGAQFLYGSDTETASSDYYTMYGFVAHDATSGYLVNTLGTSAIGQYSNLNDYMRYNGTASLLVRSSTTAPVPEPATMLLFGTGLAGLVAVRRKKNK